MSMKQTLTRIFNPEIPDYHGEEVVGELNGYEYVGWVTGSRGEFYVIQTTSGTLQLVKNIRRKCDIARRQ